jgi:hypothetical protein
LYSSTSTRYNRGSRAEIKEGGVVAFSHDHPRLKTEEVHPKLRNKFIINYFNTKAKKKKEGQVRFYL